MPPEPCCSFLYDLDSQLKDVVALRCLGGFVVTQQYGIGRGTSDIGACANMGIWARFKPPAWLAAIPQLPERDDDGRLPGLT
jgi:hypothetical protein